MRPRIAVIGAVGGYVGGYLARIGQDMMLIDPWPAHVEAIRAHGLELEGVTPKESCTVRVDAIRLTELQDSPSSVRWTSRSLHSSFTARSGRPR